MSRGDSSQLPFALVMLLVAFPAALAAQTDSTCSSYDRCALAFQYTFGGRYLVRGVERERVARIGFTAPPLVELAMREDSVGTYIRQFRADHTPGVWLSLVGGFAAGVALAWGIDDPDRAPWQLGCMAIGFGFTVWGGIKLRRSENALQRAVWLYNRSLQYP